MLMVGCAAAGQELVEGRVRTKRCRVELTHDERAELEALVDAYFPYATVIRVVLDNLNIHTLASLYEAFPPAEARRIARKLEFHYTPKHGSWLNKAEAEHALLSRPAHAQAPLPLLIAGVDTRREGQVGGGCPLAAQAALSRRAWDLARSYDEN